MAAPNVSAHLRASYLAFQTLRSSLLHAGCCVHVMSCPCSLLSPQNKILLPVAVPHLVILLCTPKLIQIYPRRRKQQHCTGKYSREHFKEAADAESVPADAGSPGKAIVPAKVLVLPGSQELMAFTSFNTQDSCLWFRQIWGA